MKLILLILAGLGALPCWGQTPPAATTGSAQTHGVCSPAVSGNKNTFFIKCGVDSAQGRRMVEILNKVLANQLDPVVVMAKLDEILQASKQSQQVVNAPNGIGSIGGTLLNPTVNNFGPPPAHLTFTEVITPGGSAANESGFQILTVHIKTDRSIPGAIVGVRLSGAVELGKEKSGLDDPILRGAPIQQINWGGPLERNGAVVPNSYAFTINAPAAFLPGMELLIVARSREVVHVLEVGSVIAGEP